MRNLNQKTYDLNNDFDEGFILTMRNLNNNSMSYNPLNLIGFILTMRNLNYLNQNQTTQLKIVLY